MSTIRYIISDASKRVDVEPHVLRYWEEELEIEIPRNEMGHRYYKDEHIEMFKTVKTLKDQGFQLKAIKLLLSDINSSGGLDTQDILKLREELNSKVINLNTSEELVERTESVPDDNVSHKMGQFKTIMNSLIVNALQENNSTLTENLSTDISESVIKEMDYLLRLKEEREEERYKRFDETIRDYQKSRSEVAAARDSKNRKKGMLFHRKRPV